MSHSLQKHKGTSVPHNNNNVEVLGGGRIKWLLARNVTDQEASKVRVFENKV